MEVKENIENLEKIKKDLQCIKVWISQQQEFNARTDDEWLLIFLQGCKFSLQRTKEKIYNFYSMRYDLPEFFTNRDPLQPELQKALSLGLFLPLAKSNKSKSRFIYHGCKHMDLSKISILDVIKISIMIVDIMFLEDINNYDGTKVELICDADTLNMDQVIQITPMLIKKLLTYLHNSYPIRPQGIHVLNAPKFYGSLFNTLKPIVGKKISDRVYIYPKDLNEFYERVDTDILPSDLGGAGDTLNELTLKWKQKVESYRQRYIEDAKCGFYEKPQQEKSELFEPFGAEGSFRQLRID